MDDNNISNIKIEPYEESNDDGFYEGRNGKSSANTAKIIYELSADAVISFSNGDSINVNKTMLAFYSPVFAEMFFGLSKGNIVTIHEYDCETFKKFLDCVFGFKDYTAADALSMYPIAHKFKIQKCLDDCKIKLTPCSSSEMNENICRTLNLALMYNCQELTDSVVTFLKNSAGILNLFEREDYFFLLEPSSVLKVVENVKMNSFLIEVLYKWGVHYLEKNNKAVGIRCFFEENKILEKISLLFMDSFESIFKFQIISKEELFTCSEVLNHISETLLKVPKIFPLDSLWVKKKKGDTVKEIINFRQPLYVNKLVHGKETKLKIWRNNILYDFINGKDEEEDSALDFSISYSYKKEFCRLHCRHSNDLYKSQIHDFFVKKGTLKVNPGKRYARLSIDDSDIDKIFFVVIEYTFQIDCRILKSSLDIVPLAYDGKELCFTCGIEMC